MPKIASICFFGRLTHRTCLDSLFKNSEVKAIVIAGPQMIPLPFLEDPKGFAKSLGVAVFDSDQIDSEQLIELAAQVDVAVSVGCARLLKKRELEAPRFGTFNLHPAELPKYRGKHPDLFAIMDGQSRVGVTLHRMDTGIDTGPIVAQLTEPVLTDDTIVTMTDKLYSRGAVLLSELLADLANDSQIEQVSQARRFDPLDLRKIIDWHDSAWRINNLVRALTYPWPMAKTIVAGKPILISRLRIVEDGLINPGYLLAVSDDAIRVGTGGNSVDILEIRDEEKKIIPLKELADEFRSMVGQIPFGYEQGGHKCL